MNKIPTDFQVFSRLAAAMPNAVAYMKGSPEYPDIYGMLKLYQAENGVYVAAAIYGLPVPSSKCGNTVFAFHIHNGTGCSGDKAEAFSDAGTHYNPTDCPHPLHSGDMPPLFSNGGNAWSVFLTDRFSVCDVIGLPVIIHLSSDDFMTQPSGNSGTKIACGIIQAVK